VTAVQQLVSPPGLTWKLTIPDPQGLPVPADGEALAPIPTWADGTGAGVRVCVIDSGVEAGHPLVGPIAGSWRVVQDEDGHHVAQAPAGDACGHGTACAGIIRRVAPGCEIHSLRVLGESRTATGDTMLAGLRWAVRQDFHVINLSLSTTKARFAAELHQLADEAFFRSVAIVASAHNTPVESFPWRFASVISVGSHPYEKSGEMYLYNPHPPVEFFALGQNVEVAWPGGGSTRATGNSFATPFVAGLCARVLSRFPKTTLFQLKNALYLSASNVHATTGGQP
jgi:subtilisin family serine protease